MARVQVRREESRNFSALVPEERVFEFVNLQKAVKQWIEEVLSIKLQDGSYCTYFKIFGHKKIIGIDLLNQICFSRLTLNNINIGVQ